jgi:hypothetical protein
MTEAPWPPVTELGQGHVPPDVQALLDEVQIPDDPDEQAAMLARGQARLATVKDSATDPKPDRPSFASYVLSRAQLNDLPQPEPLITDTLDQRTVTLLSGRRSSGKSFIALDWALCIATGKPWQTRPVTRTGRVLYVAAEGAHGLDQRVDAWEYAWQTAAPDLDVLPLPVNLFKGGSTYDELRTHIHARQYPFVVIDTWARSTVGGKENDNSDSTIAFERVDAIRRLNTSVLVVAHTDGADTKTRGATALEDNADVVYRVKEDSGEISLFRDKRKDGPTEDRHQLQLRTIELGAGRTSCVVESSRGQIVSVSGKAEDLLSVFMDLFADMGCSKAELRRAAALAPATFDRALKALVRTGALINHGTDQRPFYKPGTIHAT